MAFGALSAALMLWRRDVGFLLVPVLLLCPLSALAEENLQGKAENSTIREISTQLNNEPSVVVNPSKTIEGKRPKCATNTNVFSINPNTAQGRAAIASILSAVAEGYLVDLYGSGKCNPKVKGDAEELEAVKVKIK